MCEFRFAIPIKFEDLVSGSGQIDVYRVRYEYTDKEVGHKLKDCQENLKSMGPDFILQDFDVFYCLLVHFNNLEQKYKDLGWRIISNAVRDLESNLQSVLPDVQVNASPEERLTICNTIKMIVYIFCKMVELFEDQDIKQQSQVSISDADKKRSKQVKRTNESYDWQQNKEKGMEMLLKLFSLPIHRVFNPPIVEDEFVNVITKCCYKMLENPLINKQKSSTLQTNIFHILGNAIEKHRQSLGFCLKIIQLLQTREHLVSTLANLIELIVKKHNQKVIVTEIVREIRRIDIKELSRDSSGPKAISAFLVEVAERCPSEMLPSISYLLEFLVEDSYLMRNATLSIIRILICKLLSEDNLKSKERHFRDELLDKLEEHIHDNVTFTRSKALQIWCQLCQEEAIPLTRLDTLIEIVVGRLKDKSCYVRKAAVQFLTQFLTKNPFAAKFPLEHLLEIYKLEEQRLGKMLEAAVQTNNQMISQNQEDPKILLQKLQDDWSEIEDELKNVCQESQLENFEENEEDDQENQLKKLIDGDKGFGEFLNKFRELVTNKDFKNALMLLAYFKKQFSTHELFAIENEVNESEDESDETFIEDESSQSAFNWAKKAFLYFESQKENFMDLGSKTVEKDIEKVAAVLINSQQSNEQSRNPEAPTTQIEFDNNLSYSATTEEVLVNDISKQQIVVKYLSDCIKFTKQIQIAIPLVCDLLFSKSTTDVLEAIEFFVTAFEFGVQEAIIGIRKMIVLIWSQEKSIKESIVAAYKRVYLKYDESETGKHKAFAVVKSLSELIKEATIGEQISFEKLLNELMSSGDIQAIHIQVMWERYSMKLSGTSLEDSITAVQLIGMLASSKPEIVRNNLDTLISVGLGERGLNNCRLVSETCMAIGKSFRRPNVENCEIFLKFPKNHELFSRLSNIITSTFKNEDPFWKIMCDESIKIIFNFAENPDSICEQIVRQLILVIQEQAQQQQQQVSSEDKVNENSQNNEITEPMDSQDTESSTQKTDTELVSQALESSRVVSSELLTRFISIIGNIAINMLIHLELNIFTELKIRNKLKEEKENKKDKTPKRKSRLSLRQSVGGDQNLEEEIGLAGANAIEDQEQEYLNGICNSEIVLGDNLLAKLGNLILAIVKDPIMYPNVKLRISACLALAKYMAVSETFCRLHLRLLFTIMEKSTEPTIRRNTVIAIGDLFVRFPNLLDQWSPQMVQRLRDPDNSVKKTALKVISRLILSDMIKPKGQIIELALLIVDEDDVLSSAAKLFFTEYGKKQNAIYNVLPDLISHLSDVDNGLEEDKFKTVTKFLFDLIDKDRHTVHLVEKLCQRFRTTTNERQYRDLAFCLGLLNYSERSIHKLYENLICFADKLYCDVVYENITNIIKDAKKSTNKNETKQMIDEFEQKIEECRNKGTNEDDSEFQKVVGTPTQPSSALKPTSRTAVKTTANKKKAPAKSIPKSKKPTKKRKQTVASSDEMSDDQAEAAPVQVERRSQRERTQRVTKRVIEWSEEESDE